MISSMRSCSSFPPIEHALREPNGLLAAGGDLSPQRLLVESFWSFTKRRLANFNGVPELLTNMQKLPGKDEINIAK